MFENIELRTCRFEKAKEYTAYAIQEIGIGSESCIYKIPTIEQIRELTDMTDKKIKIIFPFIAQKYLQKVKDLLDKIIEEKLHLTVVLNDIGLIAYLKKMNSPVIDVIAGRFFDWSYEMVPWNNNVLRDESVSCVDFLKRSRLHNDRKLDLLKSLNVKGIELNTTRSNLGSLEYFEQKGMETYGHYYFNTLAFTRACPYKRLNESSECIEKCDQYQKIVFNNKWVASTSFAPEKNNFSDVDRVKDMFPKIYIKENMMLQENNIKIESMSKFHGVILDDALLDMETSVRKMLKEGVGL
ncbi:hypothetical protein NNC19_15495 [Clostridium sp. SHJSY1]|uniref:hypothetical protein n=1 Tax=Clostridium sp. SHJSY1 TaxID=2942483 RepID=UPI002875FBF9|nr:hypothetical protein [Clostridium sp. SHJSY1]MDS0527096.1 hypothetical protein [Clostridium sp. SHJSY1]